MKKKYAKLHFHYAKISPNNYALFIPRNNISIQSVDTHRTFISTYNLETERKGWLTAHYSWRMRVTVHRLR
jgi:hypothetical protein